MKVPQKIEFTRGDSYFFKFQRKNANGIITEAPDYLYFSVKDNYNTKNVIFQKTINNGMVYNEEDTYWHVTINPEDTNYLPYEDYNWDIEVITPTYKKTLARGILTFEKETTFPDNEVK